MPITRLLSKKDYAAKYPQLLTLRTAFELHAAHTRQRLARLDPDSDDRAAQEARIRREGAAKLADTVLQMRATTDELTAQQPFYERPALLRRAGLAAPAHLVAIVQGAHDLGLVQLAQDAAAMDDRVLAGAIALELGRRSLAPDQLRAVSGALGTISFPEVAELNDFFKQMRDLYLTSALEALDLAPPEDSSSALKRMTWGRELDQPVLRLDPEGLR